MGAFGRFWIRPGRRHFRRLSQSYYRPGAFAFGASTRQMSRLLLTPFKKVRGGLVTSEPPWRTRTFVKRCHFTTSAIGSRASRYEEGLARGAFHSGANFRYPLVDMKRRAREWTPVPRRRLQNLHCRLDRRRTRASISRLEPPGTHMAIHLTWDQAP